MEPSDNMACDRCGVKAYYKAFKGGSLLYFCGSHTRKESKALLEQGFIIEPDNYVDFGAELEEDMFAKKQTMEAIQTQNEYEEHDAMRNKVKNLFYQNPNKAIEKIFIPIARKETNYYEPAVYRIRVSKSGQFEFIVQPQFEPATQRELDDFIAFNKVLVSLMSSTLA